MLYRFALVLLTLVMACTELSICRAIETIPNNLSIRLQPVAGRDYPPVITALAISPDGELLAAAGDDHAVRLLSGKDFSEQRIIGQHSDWVRSLDFAPDGSMLLSAGNDGRIQVWQRSRKWENPTDIAGGPALACVRFNDSGKRIAAVGFDSEIFLMQSNPIPKSKLSCDCRDLRTALFTEVNDILAVGGRSGELHFIHPDTGENLGAVSLHLGRLRDSTLVRGANMIVSVGEDGRCAIVDTVQMKMLREVTIPGCKLLSVAAIDSQHVAVGGSDNLIRVLNVNTGEITKKLTGHQGTVAVLKANVEHLISGSYDTSIRFWRLSQIQQHETVAGIPGVEAADTISTQATER
ncbi:WD domain, G-beta repeat [Rosistilla carotiformis]|uniref:WD domain, G-beta repeat n=1 Tax=Rosistilla carotiformis TaxID=2528017 RepID=A0A518JWH2_9BACT|nr:WD40 repeat domain-containing protein [Rosistilla carotiformis]QDV69891.1 WD domain, G-beta repeat [Rosistilla carotiformis]